MNCPKYLLTWAHGDGFSTLTPENGDECLLFHGFSYGFVNYTDE